MQRIGKIIVLICIAAFPLGLFGIFHGWITKDWYIVITGVGGSIASIASLWSFFRPLITRTDLQQLEIESLRSIQKATQEIEKLEQSRSEAKKDLDDLHNQKKHLEILVQRASLSLFLKEQKRLYEARIIETIHQDKELSIAFKKIDEIDDKLIALNEELNSDPDAAMIREVVRAAEKFRSRDSAFQILEGTMPMTTGILKVLTRLGRG